MKTLMVSPYAPYRDGIAVYAVQEVRQLRADGVDVEVLSPLPSAAHHHLGLGGPRGLVRLANLVKDFDRVVLQLYPELILGACRNPIERAAAWTALAGVCRRKPTELRVHEIDYGPALKHKVERRAARAAMMAADVVTVHTPPEAARLEEVFGVKATIVDHGIHFRKRGNANQAEARFELGLPPDEHVMLAIGFLQNHKGFDRAIKAFAAVAPEQASLHVVGSVRVEVPELVDHANELERLADSVPNAYLHRRFVGDEEFDRWIIAADTIVLPYREIWSSGVLERAKLYERPVIASRVGGLADQIAQGSELFSDDAELITAMRHRLGLEIPEPGTSQNPMIEGEMNEAEMTDPVDRNQIEAEVRNSLGIRVQPAGNRSFTRPEALALAPASSARPGISQLKRMVQVATAWQIRPLVERINALEAAVEEAFERLDRDEN